MNTDREVTKANPEVIARLRSMVGPQNVLSERAELEPYSHDGTFLNAFPDFAVIPSTTEQVSAVMSLLHELEIPMTARGAGSGLSGGSVPLHGGAVICLDRLTSLEIDPNSLVARVGAGVVTGDLQREAERHGLMYPPDPASVDMCTIGGNIATNAGGPSCLKYGVTSEYILGLTVVLASGEVVRVGGMTRKRSAGYRLHQLFIGSEGTLGIVTEAILRLVPSPHERATALAAFRSVEEAAQAVAEILHQGHLPAACELMDRSSLDFVSDLLPSDFPTDAQAVLLIEHDGDDESNVHVQVEQSADLCRKAGAFGIKIDSSRRGDLWQARRSIGLRLIERRAFRLPEDIAVPIDQIPEMVSEIQTICRELGVGVAIFGHAGDGNLHPSLLFDDRAPETLKKVSEAASRIFHSAIKRGGTISAEHGLGAIKRDFAGQEIEPVANRMMAGIKQLLDPKGLLNPGKVLPSGRPPDASFMDTLPGWRRDSQDSPE